MTGNLAGEFFAVNEDQDLRLTRYRKWDCQKALVIAQILDIVDNFMCGIYHVWTV
jgi:hypothetical protein